MAARSVFKHEFLENTIESLQCFKCKDVPGFSEKQRNRYSCHDNAHQLCEKCKGTFLSESTYVFIITLNRQTFFFTKTEDLNFGDF